MVSVSHHETVCTSLGQDACQTKFRLLCLKKKLTADPSRNLVVDIQIQKSLTANEYKMPNRFT